MVACNWGGIFLFLCKLLLYRCRSLSSSRASAFVCLVIHLFGNCRHSTFSVNIFNLGVSSSMTPLIWNPGTSSVMIAGSSRRLAWRTAATSGLVAENGSVGLWFFRPLTVSADKRGRCVNEVSVWLVMMAAVQKAGFCPDVCRVMRGPRVPISKLLPPSVFTYLLESKSKCDLCTCSSGTQDCWWRDPKSFSVTGLTLSGYPSP